MAYTIHIERDPIISLEEWRNAVLSIEDIKIDNSKYEAVNPKTGEVISMGSNDSGDVAILFLSKGILGFAKKQEWKKCISFTNGRASFNATPDIEDKNNPVHKAVSELALKLSARIIGDEGEEYKW